jgi:inner membrane protein
LPTGNQKGHAVDNKILSKLDVIGALSLVLLVPLFLIGAQITGRSARQSEVLQEIADSAAGSQTIIGPVCVIRYHELVQDAARQDIVQGMLVLPPEALDISGEARVETRSRGIYHARLFHSALRVSGNFQVPAEIGLDPRRKIVDAEAFLVVAVSDPRGISNDPVVLVNGAQNRFSTGTLGLNDRSGVKVALGALVPNRQVAGTRAPSLKEAPRYALKSSFTARFA